MRNEWIRARLKELEARGKNQKGLAEALDLPSPRISEMISGKREIAGKEVRPLADYLELPEPLVLSHITGASARNERISAVPIIGFVQAGAWREALELPQEEWRLVPVAANGRYEQIRRYGLEVRGPSMNEVYPEGAVIICVKLIDLGREPRHGERVVVQRRSDLGFEATVKEFRQDPDGTFWLWPRSTDPNFQQPWRLPKPDEYDDNEDIRLVALVIGSYRPE